MTNFLSVGILVILFLGILSSSQAAGGVDELLGNRAFVQKQVDCALDKGPCDGLGELLKSKIYGISLLFQIRSSVF